MKSFTMYSPQILFGNVAILLLGFFSNFYINLVGQLYVTELILIALLPVFLVFQRSAVRVLINTRLVRIILIFGLLWFLSQVLSDLIHSTAINNLLRGWSAILVFFADFMVLFLLTYMKVLRVKLFILGYVLGAFVALYVQPPVFFKGEPWKFGFGYPIILLVLLIISYLGQKKLRLLQISNIFILLLGLFSFYLNARTLGTELLVTAFVIWLRDWKLGKLLLGRLTPVKSILGLGVIGLFVFGVAAFYGYAAGSGLLGEKARQKYEMQSVGVYGILIGGRPEILASMQAVADSPWLGHGSWAVGPQYRLFLFEQLSLGYGGTYEQLQSYIEGSDEIPAHSHFFQAWVWAGILGAIFWATVLILIASSFIQTNRTSSSFYVFVVYLAVQSVWDIFFSPFGSVMRLRWALRLVIFIMAYYQSVRIKKDELFKLRELTVNEA